MNDLLSYVIESFFDSRQEKLNQLNTPEKLKSSDVVEYVRSNMKGSKTKQGAFLREGALYFLNAMAKEGGALDRGKPGTVAPGYAFEGGKREYGRVRGDSPLRKLQRPLIVPEVDYPGVPDSRLQDVVVAEALALFRAWSNRNKPRFFDYKLSKPMTGDSPEVEELMELYRNHNRRFMRIHQLVAENNETQPIYFDPKKGKLPIGTEGIQTGITITRPPQAMWICLKLRKKAGASWTMYTNSVAKLGSMLNRAGMPSMVSTYGKLWDLWTILPDEVSAPDAYDMIGSVDGITRVGRTTKGVAFRSFLMDSVLIDESTFSNNTSIFPLSLQIHHGESKVATLQEGEGNQDFTKDSGLSMIPATGTLAQFDVGIDNHPLQAMYNAPDLVARVYRFARTARIIPQLEPGLPTIEIDTEASNQARNYWTSLKQMDGGDFYEGELKQIPSGRDITIEFDGEKAYLTGFPNDRKLTNLIQTDEFEQLYDRPATAFARISGKDANALATFISQLDPNDFDEKRVKEAFQDRILTIWGLSCTLEGEFEPFTPISDVSGRFIRAAKQAKPDDIEEMLAVSPEGLIGTVEPSEDRKEEKLIFGERTTPVVVLGYEKASVQNQEARVIIVGKVVEEVVDVLVPGVRKPTRKAGKERREQYQEVARVGAFSGFNYEDRKDLLSYMESLNYQREHEGDILIDPVEANIIFEMSYKGLLADKQMWRYNRTGKSKEVGVKQDLPGGGERFVKGVKTRFIMEPKEKNAIAQYNNPKIIGYRSEMGREEQRIYPMLIPSSDVTYGVALKSNPPIQISKYTNFVEKENSPLIAALGFTDEKFASEDLKPFRSRMKEKHGDSTVVVQSGKTLVAHKKGAKLGELCDNCSAPKAFSPPAEIRQERAADEGPSITFICDVCGRQSYQRDRRNPPLGTKGWNVVLDFDQSKYKDEMKQIKNAFAKMKEWFPGANFEWDEVLQGGDLGIKDWGPGEQYWEAQKIIQEAADEFSKDRNMLIITDGGYKRTWFGYTSTIYPSGSRDGESFRLWLFALPHLQMYDEEMNLITLCHEIGHALFPSGHYKDERKYYEGQTPIKGRFDDTGHCKDYDCAMSLGSYKMNAFKDQLKKEGRHDNVNMFCELCRAQMGLHNTGIITKKNPLVSVEETEGDMKLATKLLRYMQYDLEEEVKPYLHTNWPSWYRRAERDLIVRGLERFDYQSVIEGMVNKTGSTYYNTMFNIAKRNSGKPLIKNRTEHQELAMLYSLCHNDLELIVAWPNATSSDRIGAFEEELEATGTIVYQKEVKLSRNAAEVLCMQMYAGESFLSKKQCQKKALASGWERSDEPLGKGRKMRVYLYYNDSENSLRGKAAKRKEELREIFKTSSSDRKSYIHTADNAVQVSEYAQVFFNENSLMLLHNCDIDIILPEKPDKAWMMLNSVKKYIQQELGSLFLICSRVTSGSGAYLHGIRRTQDVDFMIDDRRLGPEVKTKMQEVKQMMPWFDFKLAYSNRNLWDFETFVPGKTFYDKRSEMTHNPKYHAYFCGMKVETPETFLYMRTIRASADARPRAVADMLMLKLFMDRGRFLQLKDIYKLVLPIRQIQATVIANHDGNVKGWLQTIKFFMQERYREKYTHAEIQQMIRENRVQTKRNPLDTDAIEERLLAGVEGSFTDESETRRNPGGATVVITVPHALHAGPDVEEHWCDWSAAPAGRQIDKIMSKDHKTILHLADKKRTEIDYNRVASADTKWQYRLDDYIEKASMLLDIHSFPPDDVMWAGYDFVLFNSSEWPQQRQMEQAKLQDHLVKKGYKVFMDIADHRNYIQEKGIKAGIPSFLIEFNEELSLKESCDDLIDGLEDILFKDNPVQMLLRDNPLRGTSAKHFDRAMAEGHFKPRKGGGYYQGYTAVWAAAGEGDGHAETAFDYATHAKGGFDDAPKNRVPVVHYIPESEDMEKQRAYSFDEMAKAVRFPNGVKAEDTREVWRGQSFREWQSHRTGLLKRMRDGLTSLHDNERQWHLFQRYKRDQRRSFDLALNEFRKTLKPNPMPPGMRKLEGAERPTGPFYHGTTMELAKIYMEKGKKDERQYYRYDWQVLAEDPTHPNAIKGMFVNKTPLGKNSAMSYAQLAAHNEYQWDVKDGIMPPTITTPVVLEVLPDGLDFYSPPESYLYAEEGIRNENDTFLVVTRGYDGGYPLDTIPPENLRIAFVDEEYDVKEAPLEIRSMPKLNPVLPKKRHGYFPKADYITEVPGEEEIHNEIQAHQKKHNALVQSIMKKDFSKTWTWKRPVAEDKKEAEMKALKKAKKKADKELGDFKVCREECLYCYIEQTKTNPTPHFFPGDAVKKYPWLKYADLIKTNPHEAGHLEPPAPGMTRLWRGDFANKYPLVPRGPEPKADGTRKSFNDWATWKYAGRYFTPDMDYAMSYANTPGEGHESKSPGEKVLMYIDVPNEDLSKYHMPFILGKMREQEIELGLGGSLMKAREWFKMGKITPEQMPYPHYGHSYATPGNKAAAEKEYWIGPDVELYGKVKVHSTWTDNPPKKDLYDVFEEWCSLVNMTNKELETFLNSNWGKVAGLSKQEAKDWNDIKSGRVSGRRILKMREKIGFSGPNDQIKSQIDIGKAWEKALKNWTGPSNDSMKGETDWDWCKRQVRFNKRAGAFPYNQNAEERKGALVKKQKTQNQPSRRLLSLWVWGHDPWRWAYDNDVARMPKCPNTAWVGNKEKRKYGKIEVIAGPKKNFIMSLPYLFSQILRGIVYSEDGLEPKENPPAENITWTKMPPRKMELPGPAAGTPLETFYELRGVDEDGHTVTIKTTKYNTDTEYRNKDGKLFTNTAVSSQEWLKGLGVEDYFYVVGIEASKKMIGLGQAAYIQLAKIVPAVLSTNHSESAERAWQGVERNAAQHGLVVHRRKIEYPVGKDTGFRYDRVLMKDTKENPPTHELQSIPLVPSGETIATVEEVYSNPPIFPEPERISKVKGGRYKMDSGQDVSGMHFSDAVILGSDKSINVEWKNQEEEPEPKPAPKSGLRRIRFNMLRPSKFDGYKDAWIVASETSKGHIYSLSVEVQTTLTLKTFPGKKSEPRLRPETYGSLHPLNKIGEITIKSSGKKHPLYDRVFVMDSKENKKVPKNRYRKLAQGKKHKGCKCNKKAYRSERQAHDDIPYGWTVYPCPDVAGIYHASSPRRNKGGGRSERLYGITVPFVKTLHPKLDEFTARSLVERLKNAGKGKQAESRQLGRILTRMAREGLVQQLPRGVYRNTEARYQEYLDEQEEPKDNPRTKKGRKVPTRYLKGLNSVERAIAKYEIDKGYEYDIDDPEAYEFWKSDIMAKARGMENQPSTWKLKFIKKYGPLPKGKNIVSRLAKATGIKKKYIQKAYDKGLAAWRGGHRPGVQQHQWAVGRAYALVMGAPTSTGKGKPDFKLAVEAGVRNEKGKLLI